MPKRQPTKKNYHEPPTIETTLEAANAWLRLGYKLREVKKHEGNYYAVLSRE